MLQYLIMFRSLTFTQRAARTLERAGITASISRAPQGLTFEGCGYCVKVSERKFSQALDVLRRAGLSHGRIYRQNADGTYTEVSA